MMKKYKVFCPGITGYEIIQVKPDFLIKAIYEAVDGGQFLLACAFKEVPE